jgi:lipoate-protein ligase A
LIYGLCHRSLAIAHFYFLLPIGYWLLAIMTQTWRFLKYETHDAPYNMAIDEAMLTLQSKCNLKPTLRVYGWTRPTFSFGYFQKMDDEVEVEACRMAKVDLIKRPTGGGMVVHGWDLTYTVVVGLDNPLIPREPINSYRIIGQCVVEALKDLGIEAYTSSSASEADLNVCLAKSALYDVMIENKKVAGAAQRRRKGVLLNQGYIALDMPPPWMLSLGSKDGGLVKIAHQSSSCVNSNLKTQLEAEAFASIVAKGFRKTLGIQLVEDEITAAEYELADQLRLKYSSDEWNFK